LTGDIISNGAANLTFPAGTLSISGNLGLGTGAAGINANGGTIDFNGSGTQTISFGDIMTLSLNNIIHSGSGSLVMGSGTEYLELASVSNTGGILDFAGSAIFITSLTNNATMKLTGAESNLPVPTLGASSLVQFYGTSGPYTLPSWSYAGLQLSSASATTYNPPASLAINGNFTVDANNTFSPGSGTVTFGGTSAVSGAGTYSFNNLTITGSLTASAGTINVTGDWTNSGTFTANGGTINFSGAVQAISGVGTGNFYNLSISNTAPSPSNAATTTPSVAIAVDNLLTVATGQFQPVTGSSFKDITINSGAILKPAASATINVSGNWVNNGTFTNNSATINFNGTSTISGSNNFFRQISIAAGASLTLASDITMTNDFTNDGTFSAGSQTVIIAGTVDLAGTQDITFYNITTDGGELRPSATKTLNIGGTLWIKTGSFFTAGNNSTINFTGAASTIINDKTTAVSFNNLGIGVGATLTAPTTHNSIEVKGNFTNNGTFNPLSGTISFTCAKNQTISQAAGIETTLNNLTINACDSSFKVTLPSTKLKIAGAFTNDGTFNANGGSVDFNGTTALSGTFDGASNNRFNTVYITGTLTASSGTMNFHGDLVNTGTFNHNNGTVAFVGTSGTADSDGANFYNLITSSAINFNLTGNIGVAGNFTNSGGGFTPNAFKVTFNGSGAQAITGATSFYDLEIANTAASPDDSTDIGPTASTTVTNLLTVSDGQFQPFTGSNFKNITISAGGILKPASSASINISGDLTSAGTFSGNSGTAVFNGANSQFSNTVDGGVSFNNLTIASGASLTAADATTRLGVSGNWTNDGTFDPGTNSVVTFNGASAILGSGTHNFKNITLSNGTLTAPAGDLTLGADFTNNSGTFDPNGGTIIFTGASADIAGTTGSTFNNLTINSGGLLRMHRSFSLTGDFSNQGTFTYNNATYSHENTVTFSGVGQSLSGSTTFYNLAKTTATADTLTFEAGETQTIDNGLTLHGVSGGLLSLRSSVDGTPWEIDPQGTLDLEYIDVKDSTNVSGTDIDCVGKHCTDSTDNTNWTFDPPPVIETVVSVARSSAGSVMGPIAPLGGFKATINEGAVTTNNRLVRLNLTGGSNTSRVEISNRADFSDSFTYDYQPLLGWDLCFSGGQRLPDNLCWSAKYTVYVKFKTIFGRATDPIAISITYQGPVAQAGQTQNYIENQVVAPSSLAGTVGEVIDNLIPDFLKPEPPIIEPPPVPVIISQEAPDVFKGKWTLLPRKEIKTFVLAPLPKEFGALTAKFQQLDKTFTSVGLNRASDLPQLIGTNINLPTLAQATNMSTNSSLDKLSVEARAKVPKDYVFVRGGAGIIDFQKILSLNQQGEPVQTLGSLVGAPMTLVIRPNQPAKSVQGYIIFKERKMATNYGTTNSGWAKMAASPIFALANLGQRTIKSSESKVEQKLVLDRFEYTDDNQDGLYLATISAPLVAGEYEIITTIDYVDKSLPSKETSFIAVIDPEGYVYEKYGDKEIRIPDAKVTLLWLNPKSQAYENWPAADYQQKNPQVTLQSGSYSFLVPEGTYLLQVEAKGYQTYRGESFKVVSGSGVHSDVELKPTWWWMKWLDWQAGMFVVVLALLLYNFYKDKVRERKLKKHD
jgi:hypothetical protein